WSRAFRVGPKTAMPCTARAMGHGARRGLRMRHARKGTPGTWEVPCVRFAENRYRGREGRPKRPGTSSGTSERLIVPAKPANSPREEPAEGRGRRVMER